MSVIALPDIVGLLGLIGILEWLRQKQQSKTVNAWLLGMLFVLAEVMAVAVYRGSSAVHTWMHVLALDAYVLAGVTFGWASRQDLLPGRAHVPFFVVPAVPLFVLTTLYGLDVQNTESYIFTVLVSLVLGLIFIQALGGTTLRLRLTLVGMHLTIWAPMLLLAMQGQLRWVVYWGLTCLYLLVAFSFRARVRRGALGGLVIMGGFTVWALCFLVHPLMHTHANWDPTVENIWSLQKFVVIVGMLVTLLEDETELRKSQALHDALTGLPNRRLFEDRLAQSLERALRSGLSTALFVVDLNGFKTINDTQGHRMGDLVLQAAATGLQGTVRSSDTLSRLGGDEFCVIVNDLTRSADCERIADALAEALDGVEVPRLVGSVNGSVGYALFPDEAADATELYTLADRRMYERKRRGARREKVEFPRAVAEPILMERRR